MNIPFEEILERLTRIEAKLETNEQSPKIELPVGIDVAAEITDRTVAAIYTLCSQGEIPHFKKKKRLYFYPSQLNEWIKSGKRWNKSELNSISVNAVIS